jgi:predicted peptidase/lysophospholipase L1-like esterase/chitodextrinase
VELSVYSQLSIDMRKQNPLLIGFMKYLKILGAFAFLALCTGKIAAQTVIYNEFDNVYNQNRTLRTGTFSNRTPNGNNNGLDPKTWTFDSQTGWDSKFYDGKSYADASITAGSSTLTRTGSNFVVGDAGKIIEIFGAGSGGTNLTTTILTVISGTQVTLAVNASTTVSNSIIRYGSANKIAYTEGMYTTGNVGTGYPVANFEINYRLLFPVGYNQLENYKYPMIVMLHGAGERANCWGNSCFYNSNTTTLSNCSTTAGSPVVTKSGAGFNNSHLNKTVQINAGPSNNNFTATIVAVNSSTQITLSTNASVTSNSRTLIYGYGSSKDYRSNDLQLVHGGNEHLQAIYNPTTGSNGKKAEDPTLPSRAFPGFVLFPQNENGWSGPSQYEQAWRTIDLLIKAYNIDPDRIYIHGLSNGGAATWEVVRARPDLFAAALPMSASISAGAEIFNQNQDLYKAIPIPTWIFQGGKDTGPTPNNTNQIVDKLKAGGGLPRYTVYPNLGHGVWGTAYQEPDFFSWMLKQNKRNIHVLYGDTTLCSTNGNGVKLALSTGFLAYQWELDGVVISGATTSTYTATQPGTYRARFSRISASPTSGQWNAWSPAVVVKEAPAVTPVITAVGTPHLPGINNESSVRLNGPTTKDLVKLWFKNGVQTTSYNTTDKLYFSPYTDTASYTIRADAGGFKLKTIPLNGCPSLESNSIYVTLTTPTTLIAPANPTAVATGAGTVQLFWTDNTPDETGFEIFRATNPVGPYSFFKLVAQGSVSYVDSGISPNTNYYYKLRAVNNTAVSPYTANIFVTTSPDTQPPSAPQNLVVGTRTLTSVALSWTASTDDTGVASYSIYNNGTTLIASNIAATNFNVTGLTGNSNYLFTVKAIDLAGNVSQPSNQLVASTTFTGLQYATSNVNVDDLLQNDVTGNFWNAPEKTGTIANFDLTPRQQDDYFNFKFDGYVNMPAGTYNFRTRSDDGSAIYMGAPGASAYPFDFNTFINNPATNRIYNNDGLHGTQTCSTCDPVMDITFTGIARPISVIYFEKTGGNTLYVEYKPVGSGSWQVIPNNYLTSGSAPVLIPPSTPTVVSAVSSGMSSIDLSWNASTPYPNNLDIVVLGSSTAAGYGVSQANSWVGRLDTWLTTNTTGHTLTNLAMGGFSTQDVRADGSSPTPDSNRNITKALSLNPDIIIVNLPSNNVALGIPLSTTMAHYAELKAAADLAGVTILFTTTQPRDFGGSQTTERHLLEDEANAIRAAFGNKVIDIYDYLTDFSNDNRIKVSLGLGDGTHLNDTGHAYIFERALQKVLGLFIQYEVYRSTDNVQFNILSTVSTNQLFDKNLTPSTTYYYKLKAISSGGSSSFSSVASAATVGDVVAPTAPQNVTILSTNYTSVGLQWAVSTDNVGVAGYKIYANNILLGTTTNITYSTTELLPATLYDMTVTAYDASGNESAQSSPATFTTNSPQVFYSKPAVDLTLLSSWTDASNGTGSSPTSFDYDGQYFTIQNPQTLSNSLTIGGGVSRVIVNGGVTLNINQPLTGILQVGSNATVNINVDYQPVFETLAPSSTTVFNTYTTIPAASYGNLILNGTGLKNLPTGTLEVQSDLTLANGIGLKGTSSNGSIVKVGGNLITGATVASVSADNRATLQFSNATSHNFTVSSDQVFYKIAADAGATVVFNNTSGSAKSLTLGSLNGGGIDLANGSTLSLGNNTLILTNAAEVNPTNNTGELSFNNGSIQFTTTSAAAANFYFATGNNKVQNFTLQSSAGGITYVRKLMEIYDALKINAGVLNAGGNITLKSTATASAAIQQIVSGSITGNVNVERYMDAKNVYRYISSPVAGLKIVDWQNYFPITGSFTGTSTGTGLTTTPSFYYYSEPDYLVYPTTDNQAPIQVGRGYAAFIRNGTTPTTFVSTGVPTQGTFAFSSLAGGTTSTDGYSLLGNPYPSDIIWGNTGWTSSNVSETIWVRVNYANGSSEFLIWNRSGFGTLPGGKIPAGQAFWIQATNGSPTLTVNENAKTTQSASNNNNFYREASEINSGLISIKISDGSHQDYAFLNITESGSDAYDKLRDAVKRLNSFYNLSTLSSDNISLAINDVSNSFCEKIIPITLAPGENVAKVAAGTYSLQFENIENLSLANVQLIDKYLNTTTSIDQSSTTYSVVVSSDVATYRDRFYLKLTRPSIVTNNLVSSDKDNYCRSEAVNFSISNTQIGVYYEAINSANEILSDKILGNGETVELSIPTTNLLSNQIIQVRAFFGGCSSILLDNKKTIAVSEIPTVNIPTDISGCIGNAVQINAAGSGKTYQWFDENSNKLLPETSSILEIYPVNSINTYHVIAYSDNGCVSEQKNFTVNADLLKVPEIKLVSDNTLQTDATNNIQWLFNGIIIPNSTESQYVPTESGNYSVRTSTLHCTQDSPILEYVVTGIGENNFDSFSLSVYPNPAEMGKFTVMGNSKSDSVLKLSITDLVGKELMTQELSSQEFRNGVALETNLFSGVYLVRIAQDKKNIYHKVIIR